MINLINNSLFNTFIFKGKFRRDQLFDTYFLKCFYVLYTCHYLQVLCIF